MPAIFLSSQDWLLQSSQVTLNSTLVIENTLLSSSHVLHLQKEKGTVKKSDLRQKTLHHYISFHLHVFSNKKLFPAETQLKFLFLPFPPLLC